MIDKPINAVCMMQDRVRIIDDLLGGTKAMRRAGSLYLPRFPLEDEETHKARIGVSTLFPALRETIGQMTGRVFNEALNRAEITPSITDYMNNVDLVGNNLDIFASRLFRKGLEHGVAYCVVDFLASDEAQTLADAKTQGLRPFATMVDVHDVLGWQTEIISGVESLKNFRYRRVTVEYLDDFTEECFQEVVLLTRDRHTVYRKADGGDYVVYSEHPLSVNGKVLDSVPVVPFYTDKTGFFTGKPPLEDLAFLNVKHWQSQSDQDNILHTARVPLLCRIGAEEAEELAISGSVISVPADGDVKYVEHSGAAISAGRESIADLEVQMQGAGAKLITRTVVAMTDSQAKSEADKEISLLRLYANNLQDALGEVFDLFAMWVGSGDGGVIEIIGNIDTQTDQDSEMNMLLEMNKQGVISNQTLYEEAQKRGFLSDDDNWEAEQARLDGQGGMNFGNNQLSVARIEAD